MRLCPRSLVIPPALGQIRRSMDRGVVTRSLWQVWEVRTVARRK